MTTLGLLYKKLKEMNKVAVGKVVMRQKDHFLALKPHPTTVGVLRFNMTITTFLRWSVYLPNGTTIILKSDKEDYVNLLKLHGN